MTCLDCRVTIVPRQGQRGRPSPRCDECRARHRRLYARRFYARTVLSGRTCALCARCDAPLGISLKPGAKPKYCTDCRSVASKESSKKWASAHRAERRRWREMNSGKIADYRASNRDRANYQQSARRANWTEVQKQKQRDSIWLSHIKARWFGGTDIPPDALEALKTLRQFYLMERVER